MALLFLAYLVLERGVNRENVHKAEMIQVRNKGILYIPDPTTCQLVAEMNLELKCNSSAKQELHTSAYTVYIYLNCNNILQY